MKFIRIFLITLFLSVNAISAETDNSAPKLKWQYGPASESIDGKATLKIPKDYGYLDEAETTRYSELTHNPTSGKDTLFTNGKWDAYFNFDPIGYVKDTETIDADQVLEQYKKGVEIGNAERRKKGWETMEVDGWFFKPQYDKNKRLLEWAFLIKDSKTNQPVVNYYTRILGKSGVVSVILVASPEYMNEAIADFKSKLDGFDFNAGEKYTEFKQGDKVAEYGLAALILGGAAAVATKKGFWAVLAGLFAGLWKLIFIPIILFFSKVKEMIVSIFKKSDK